MNRSGMLFYLFATYDHPALDFTKGMRLKRDSPLRKRDGLSGFRDAPFAKVKRDKKRK